MCPMNVYDSPNIQSDYNSGIVKVEKANYKLILDFNNAQKEENK